MKLRSLSLFGFVKTSDVTLDFAEIEIGEIVHPLNGRLSESRLDWRMLDRLGNSKSHRLFGGEGFHTPCAAMVEWRNSGVPEAIRGWEDCPMQCGANGMRELFRSFDRVSPIWAKCENVGRT